MTYTYTIGNDRLFNEVMDPKVDKPKMDTPGARPSFKYNIKDHSLVNRSGPRPYKRYSFKNNPATDNRQGSNLGSGGGNNDTSLNNKPEEKKVVPEVKPITPSPVPPEDNKIADPNQGNQQGNQQRKGDGFFGYFQQADQVVKGADEGSYDKVKADLTRSLGRAPTVAELGAAGVNANQKYNRTIDGNRNPRFGTDVLDRLDEEDLEYGKKEKKEFLETYTKLGYNRKGGNYFMGSGFGGPGGNDGGGYGGMGPGYSRSQKSGPDEMSVQEAAEMNAKTNKARDARGDPRTWIRNGAIGLAGAVALPWALPLAGNMAGGLATMGGNFLTRSISGLWNRFTNSNQ